MKTTSGWIKSGKAAIMSLLCLAAFAVEAGSQPLSDPDLFSSPWSAFRSYSFPDHYIRHRNYLGEVTRLGSNLDQLDSTFRVVKGLAGRVDGTPTVSFESKNFPAFYLRHHHFRIKLHKNDGSEIFRKDASFKWRPGLGASLEEGFNSLESVNFPGYYIRQRSDNPNEEAARVFHLYLEKSPPKTLNSEERHSPVSRWRRDCTFKRVRRR